MKTAHEVEDKGRAIRNLEGQIKSPGSLTVWKVNNGDDH